MSSFKSHRVLVASLFLPTTAVQGESQPSTPDLSISYPVSISVAATAVAAGLPGTEVSKLGVPPISPVPKRSSFASHSRKPSNSGGAALGSSLSPLKSIVDDLKDKVRRLYAHIRTQITLCRLDEVFHPQFSLAHSGNSQSLCQSFTVQHGRRRQRGRQ